MLDVNASGEEAFLFFYFRNFAGFLIQFGAGMLLCILPFAEGAFRYPRKSVNISCGALALLSSAVFPLIMGMEVIRSSYYQAMFANLYMLVVILIFVAFYFRALQVETVKKMIALVLTLFYAATQYLLVNLVTPLFPGGMLPDIYPPLTLALYAGTAAVLLPLSALFMCRTVRAYLAEIEIENIRREFGMLILMTFLYFVILMIYSSRPAGMLADYWWWLVPPLLLDVSMLGIFYWTLFRESVRRKRDSEERKTMEIQNLQYESITHEMEQLRRLRHDMRYSMNHLSEMLALGDEKAMKEYLSELSGEISHQDTVLYCKNTTVNGLLQYYVGMAADQGIRCSVQANCGDISIAPVDLTVLLGNSLDNAIRVCGQIEGDRWITVEIGVVGDSMIIQMVNPCEKVYPSGKYPMNGTFLPAEAFQSSREGGGYGLSSLQHTAEKYDGDARFCFDEQAQTFTVRIRLNLFTE
ncbi:MAG: GHKL domain-containing protein [Lachnospiraceae bacterium]|nr:GHKL domain-containing protein [Lachnospiraceae bacterium]